MYTKSISHDSFFFFNLIKVNLDNNLQNTACKIKIKSKQKEKHTFLKMQSDGFAKNMPICIPANNC